MKVKKPREIHRRVQPEIPTVKQRPRELLSFDFPFLYANL